MNLLYHHRLISNYKTSVILNYNVFGGIFKIKSLKLTLALDIFVKRRDLNFEWATIADKGNCDEGFVEGYAMSKSNRAIEIMSFLAQHADTTQRILLTIIIAELGK